MPPAVSPEYAGPTLEDGYVPEGEPTPVTPMGRM